MFEGLKSLLFGSDKSSKSLAKSRLHFVLVQDRTGLSPDELADFKKEMLSVIEKYFVVNKGGFDVQYRREQETTTLVINSPVIVRRQETCDHSVGVRGKAARGAAKRRAGDAGATAQGAEEVPAAVNTQG